MSAPGVDEMEHGAMEEIRLYIVDDEVMAIRYFKSLVARLAEGGMPVRVVGEAPNGAQALNDILRLRPDIAFVDITMPLMTGLELSERILQQRPEQQIVLLTSHSVFGYAKKGIELGVNNYLLKDELNEAALSKIIERVSLRLKEWDGASMGGRARRVLDFLQGEGDARLLYGQESPLSRRLLIHLEPDIPVLGRAASHASAPVLRPQQQTLPGGVVVRDAVALPGGGWVLVTELASDGADELAEAVARSAVEQLRRGGWSFSALISPPVRTFAELPGLSEPLAAAAQRLYRFGPRAVLRMGEVDAPADADFDCTERSARLEALLIGGDLAGARAQLHAILDDGSRCLTIHQFRVMLVDVYGILARCLRWEDAEVLTLSNLPTLGALVDAHAHVDMLLDRVLPWYEEGYEGHSKPVLAAIRYIHAHYAQPISARDVAARAGASESYLRQQFKRETGSKLMDYLTERRIERAKALLLDPDAKVTEVCAQVGFSSSQYFSQVFKKLEHLSPGEYQRRHSRK